MDAEIIEKAKLYIEKLMKSDCGGHDVSHSHRVYRTALRLAAEENADAFTVGLAALLHDADDVKLFPETHETKANAVSFMRSCGIEDSFIDSVCRIIDEVSFKGADSVVPSTVEGKCVQDADRLDAIGAIGVGRAFAYGGSRGRAMYDPKVSPKVGMSEKEYRASDSTTINHFYEKLLLLKDLMNTSAAKRIAEERTKFMQSFLDEFLLEWKGER